MKFSYELIDALAQHYANPDTFSVPSPAHLASLKVGDSAKIGISFQPLNEDEKITGERFWVKVIDATTEGYVGEVDNNLVYASDHGIDRGKRIRFERRNVLQILSR